MNNDSNNNDSNNNGDSDDNGQKGSVDQYEQNGWIIVGYINVICNDLLT